jgi:sugar-specific transcriptional regulator TrmB
MNEDTIHNLETLGFTNYESRVFCVLFEGHSMTGSEIAKDAKIPRSSAYDVLKSFVQKGICNEIQTSSVVLFELIDPTVVEDKLEKEIHDTAKNRLSKLKDSFEKLQPLFRSKEKATEKVDVELIKGFNKHRHLKFLNLLKQAKTELLLINRFEGRVFKEQDEASLEFYKKGGVVRSIYEVSYNFKIKIDDSWHNVTPVGLIEICENYIKQGEQIKLVDKVFQNIAIFDRKIVFVNLVDPEIPVYNRSDVIIKNENYANAMAEYFNICWDKAETVDQIKNKLSIKG